MKIELYTDTQKHTIRLNIIRLDRLTSDKCRFENGSGFNKDDMEDGKILAEIFSDPYKMVKCTYQDYDAAKNILFKYHKQISEVDYRIIFGRSYEEIKKLSLIKKMSNGDYK